MYVEYVKEMIGLLVFILGLSLGVGVVFSVFYFDVIIGVILMGLFVVLGGVVIFLVFGLWWFEEV